MLAWELLGLAKFVKNLFLNESVQVIVEKIVGLNSIMQFMQAFSKLLKSAQEIRRLSDCASAPIDCYHTLMLRDFLPD